MRHLLNSPVMATEGHYCLRRVSAQRFAHELRAGPFKSYVGYAETARILSELADVKVPVSRAQTVLQDGDVMLIARLKYRVAEPGAKRQGSAPWEPKTIDDFEFFIASYSEGKE